MKTSQQLIKFSFIFAENCTETAVQTDSSLILFMDNCTAYIYAFKIYKLVLSPKMSCFF